ncbi:radical SAM protein [Patescibacteria group bacterium]
MTESTRIKKIGWGLGLCNQACRHCYNASSDDRTKVPVFSFEELKLVADKICPKVTDINFGTGEFLVNPNSRELLEYIKGTYSDVKLAVTSNGYTVNSLSSSKIKESFHDVDISIDFPDRTRHSSFRQHPQAWDWAIEALEKLASADVPRTITTCITSKLSDADIIDLLKMARNYGACFRLNWFRQTGRGKESFRLESRRAWEIIRLLASRTFFVAMDSVFAGPLGLEADRCPACYTSMRIHQDMSVTPAPYLGGVEWSAGNILHDKIGLGEIHDSVAFRKVRRRHVPSCDNCDYFEVCRGGCVTRAILHNGGLNAVDDLCPIYGDVSNDLISSIEPKFKDAGDLVHDGYLCTTIVDPN